MRYSLQSLALGLVALGVLTTTPDSSKAYWPAGLIGLRSGNGFGGVNAMAMPAARTPSNGFGGTTAAYSSGVYHSAVTPNSVSRLWFSSSSSTANSNPLTGSAMQSSRSSATANVFSPYASFRTANVQSSSNGSNKSAFAPNTSFTNGLESLTGEFIPGFTNLNPPLSPYATYLYQTDPGAAAWMSAYHSIVIADMYVGKRPIFSPNYITPNYLSPTLLSPGILTPSNRSGLNLLTPKILK